MPWNGEMAVKFLYMSWMNMILITHHALVVDVSVMT